MIFIHVNNIVQNHQDLYFQHDENQVSNKIKSNIK